MTPATCAGAAASVYASTAYRRRAARRWCRRRARAKSSSAQERALPSAPPPPPSFLPPNKWCRVSVCGAGAGAMKAAAPGSRSDRTRTIVLCRDYQTSATFTRLRPCRIAAAAPLRAKQEAEVLCKPLPAAQAHASYASASRPKRAPRSSTKRPEPPLRHAASVTLLAATAWGKNRCSITLRGAQSLTRRRSAPTTGLLLHAEL